jgi:hypothetical protein
MGVASVNDASSCTYLAKRSGKRKGLYILWIALVLTFCVIPALGQPSQPLPNDTRSTSPQALTDTSVAGPSIVPGMQVEREIYGAMFQISTDETYARVFINAQIGRSSTRGLEMTHDLSVSSIDLQDGASRLSGSFAVRFCTPPTPSSIFADLVITHDNSSPHNNSGATPDRLRRVFRGDLVTWTSPHKLVVQRFSTYSLPSLEAVVELTETASNDQTGDNILAFVNLRYAGQTFAAASVFATNPRVTLAKNAIGSLTINEGAIITYRPATPMQDGQVRLSLTATESGQIPYVYDSVIANWKWPVARQYSCVPSTSQAAQPTAPEVEP